MMILYNKFKHVECTYKVDLQDKFYKHQMFEYHNIERLLIERDINYVWLSSEPKHFEGPLAGSHILGTNKKEAYDEILIAVDEIYTNLITEKILS